jgi:hypothetical protein
VGGLGMMGISRLATALSLTFSNSLVSVGNINHDQFGRSQPRALPVA